MALRTARKARGRLARRRQTEEEGAAGRPEARPDVQSEPLIANEQAEALHVEIDRLPGSFRLPVVLCYFEGLTLDEAAQRLRWPVGTTRSRLARARDKLRRALTRRGFALPSAAIAAMLVPRSARASVSSLLCDSTTRAAIHFAARHAADGALSASAAALAQEVLNTMLVHKLKTAALALVMLATLATGAGVLTRSLAMKEGPKRGPAQPTAAPRDVARPRPTTTPDPATVGRMTVTGRVLDPSGKPLPNARVAVLADRKRRVSDLDGGHRNILMGTTAADGDGRFTLECPAIPTRHLVYLRLIATAPGGAWGWSSSRPTPRNRTPRSPWRPRRPSRGGWLTSRASPPRGSSSASPS